MNHVFELSQPSVAIEGRPERFPVHRIYCVGRNYAAHAREMGHDPDREPPFFFMKPADAVVADGDSVQYPPATSNLHYEMELVVAIGKTGAGVSKQRAPSLIWGYGVGIDLTRRDLQQTAKDMGRPWDAGKGFDASAPISSLRPVEQLGHPQSGRIWLEVNGQIKQDSDIAKLIWSVPEVIEHLSGLFTLMPGDLIYTGTPAGVGPVVAGDLLKGGVDGVASITIQIV
ncbi:MAG TPA: fumarylacetoacetate hydrolase family protein [Gammaproteobacteria bacterium]|nr:fumarylacetoacetate hydrolase family protein [Gammaproteobacteria bacterium]